MPWTAPQGSGRALEDFKPAALACVAPEQLLHVVGQVLEELLLLGLEHIELGLHHVWQVAGQARSLIASDPRLDAQPIAQRLDMLQSVHCLAVHTIDEVGVEAWCEDRIHHDEDGRIDVGEEEVEVALAVDGKVRFEKGGGARLAVDGCAEGGCEELHRVGRVDEKEKEEACGEQSVSDIALGVCGGGALGALRLTRTLLLLLLNGPAYCERNRKEDKRANGAQHEEEVEACTGEGAAEWHHLEEVELEQREPPGHTDVERRVRDREDDLERAENLDERDEDLAFGAQRLRALSAAAAGLLRAVQDGVSHVLNGSCGIPGLLEPNL